MMTERYIPDGHTKLFKHRKAHGVRQAELAQELGYANASAIWRRERPPTHPEHVPMTPRRYVEAIAAIERIAERRQSPVEEALVDVLAGRTR